MSGIDLKKWRTNAQKILSECIGINTRQLHYRLVMIGMPNDETHYKKVALKTIFG